MNFRAIVTAGFCSVLAPTFFATAQTVPSLQTQISLSFAPLVKEAAPAVVNIYAKRIVETRQSPFQNDPFFRDFFRGFGTPQPRVTNSLGSGVIVASDGVVVSNYHVVGQATDIRVILKDRREFEAEVILADQESDLAVLRIKGASDLPRLEFRNSETLDVGELVLAIGNPFGIGQTVSSGIVSGLARSGTATGNARGYFVQTDAPINPGNSGGALIDINGRLIGINTSILTKSGGSNGIGFAIPADLVRQMVEQAREGATRFMRPWAGISGQPVDASLAESLGLTFPRGMMISDLHSESPFKRAGFAVGDVITAVDGQEVNTPAEMLYRLTVKGIGKSARIARSTQGVISEIEVDLIAPPNRPAANPVTLGAKSRIPDLSLSRINPVVAMEFGLPFGLEGVMVTDTGPIGARIGLRPGDILRRINGEEIRKTTDVDPILETAGRWLSFDIERGGRLLSLRVRG